MVDRTQAFGRSRTVTPAAWTILVSILGLYLVSRLNSDAGFELLIRFAHAPDLVAEGEWYRMVTAMFLHSQSSIFHIAFNSWALWLFGTVLERRYGSLSFLALYFAAGMSGAAAYQLSGTNFAIGASGAIFGLFGALLVSSYQQRHTPAGRAAFTQLGVLLAINMALPFFVPGIAWQAHVGGLAAGILVAAAWDRIPVDGTSATPRRVAVALAVMVIAFVVAITF